MRHKEEKNEPDEGSGLLSEISWPTHPHHAWGWGRHGAVLANVLSGQLWLSLQLQTLRSKAPTQQVWWKVLDANPESVTLAGRAFLGSQGKIWLVGTYDSAAEAVALPGGRGLDGRVCGGWEGRSCRGLRKTIHLLAPQGHSLEVTWTPENQARSSSTEISAHTPAPLARRGGGWGKGLLIQAFGNIPTHFPAGQPKLLSKYFTFHFFSRSAHRVFLPSSPCWPFCWGPASAALHQIDMLSRNQANSALSPVGGTDTGDGPWMASGSLPSTQRDTGWRGSGTRGLTDCEFWHPDYRGQL